MSSSFNPQNRLKLKAVFRTAHGDPCEKPEAAPDEALTESEKLVPMSFRVTEDERVQIRKDAGKLAVSTYIRQKLVGDKTAERKPQHTQKQRQPAIDHKTLAQLLGLLGHSELATSLIALALAAQSGSLPVTPELSEKLHTACDDVHTMRVQLITALNVKAESGQ